MTVSKEEHKIVNIKDIYIVKIYYEDNQKYFKNRPIVIINKTLDDFNEEVYMISEITSSKPKIPPSCYDIYKEPIVKWRKSGLAKMSFIKANKSYTIKRESLCKKIGIMEDDDFIRAVTKIIEYNNCHNKDF